MRQLFQYDAQVGYRFIPNLQARVVHESGGYPIRVNSLGFRCDREPADGRSADGKRILVFGDSFVAGDGVPNPTRFSDRIESLLPSTEVLNFGLPASGLDQQQLVHRHFGSSIDHDLLVIGVYLEGVRRLGAGYRPHIEESGRITIYEKPRFELEHGELVLQNVPVPKIPFRDAVLSYDDSETLRRLKQRARAGASHPVAAEYDDPDNPSWMLMRAILTDWVSNHSSPVLVVALPPFEYVEETQAPSDYAMRFGDLARDTGCYFHDPLPDLVRYGAVERRSFRFDKDIHPTPVGHAALADSIAPVVADIFDQHARTSDAATSSRTRS